MEQLKTIQKYLTKLGISQEATEVFIELTKLGPSSALQLTRKLNISRTQVYRYLEELKAVSLTSAEKLSYGTLFRALPLTNIEGLIANKEAENAALRRNLNSMTALLQQVAGTDGPEATVRHYYGLAGLKQVNWNLTKADKEYRVFEAAHLNQHLDKAFARRCREQYIQRDLTSYDLTNSIQVTSQDLEPYDPEKTFIRFIDPNVLAINFEVYIYNDIVALLDYSQENQQAIEIQHPAYKAMMQQLFDAMWHIAKPLNID